MAYYMKKGVFAALFLVCLSVAGFSQSVNLSSSNLPIVVINTNNQTIVSEPKIMADMGVIFNPGNARNSITDPFNHYNGKIGIEIRGQSSQGFPMKSYSIELQTPAGVALDQSMLGMPSESDWVLYAPYTDKTLMRNFLAYTMAREMGRWAANCRFVELIVNGDYKGVYVFMEKIKRHSSRVDIARLTATDVSGDNLTGGYIFSLDKEPNGWTSSFPTPNSTNNNRRRFSYVYPKVNEILPAQQAYIKSYVDAFESSLAANNFQDPFNGVRKYADLSSFIDYFIVNEVSRNVDGYRLSSYFYKDKDSKNPKIKAGPVWDYDLAFRNADYCSGSDVGGWAYQFNNVCPGDGAGLIPFWWERFMQDTAYTAQLRCRWKDVSSKSVNMTRFTKLIDSVSALLNEAQARHFTRWNILGRYVWPNPSPIATSYAQELDYLKQWLGSRLAWINSSLPNTGGCYDFPPDFNASVIVKVIPNPVNASSYLQVQSRFNQEMFLQITDMLGRNMGSRKIQIRAGMNNLPLQAGSWASGIYVLRLSTTNGENLSFKLVK